MDNSSSIFQVIVPLVAAAIAAAIALVVSVLTKENKISEFRQAWIEGLRTDVADLLGEFHVLETACEISLEPFSEVIDRRAAFDKFFVEHKVQYIKVDALCNRIVLRLNPSEHALVISKLTELESSVGSGTDKSLALSLVLVQEFSVILKDEWARVKNGEPIYKDTKRVAVGTLLFAISLAFLLALKLFLK